MKTNIFINNFFAAFLFYSLIIVLFLIFIYYNGNTEILSEKHFFNFDAVHYYFIQENGYQDFRVAFFPLFPFLWKISHLSPYGISILNGFFFLLGFSLLFFILHSNGTWRDRNFYLLLSVPSLFFMFIPYSEAVFFLTSTLLLLGYYRNSSWLLGCGFLLCSLTRPVAFVFIPAIWLTEFLTLPIIHQNKIPLNIFTAHSSVVARRNFLKNCCFYSVIVLGGMLLVFFIQYCYTGVWLSFFEVQKNGWGNELRLPHFPLGTWGGGNIVRLDGSAMLCGIAACIISFFWILNTLKKNMIYQNENKVLIFSTLYIAGISLLILFTRGGSLFSLNRFIFCTPFFLVCLFHCVKKTYFSNRHFLFLFIGITIFWFLFASYVHIQYFLKFTALTLYLILFLLIPNKNKWISNFAFYVCLTGNITLQIYFFSKFLNEYWIG